MIAPVIVVGMGQLGSAFAQAFLKLGHPVIPVLRGERVEEASRGQNPALVILAVGEDDFAEALIAIPPSLKGRVVLLQNELRPDQWLSYDAYQGSDPNVAVIWFEKKKGHAIHVVQPSVLCGPHAALLARACEKLEVPCRILEGEENSVRRDLAFELVVKNLYILGLNLAGMEVGGNAGQLLGENHEAFDRILCDVLELERNILLSTRALGPHGAAYAKLQLDEEALKRAVKVAIVADPAHGCAGRSAPRRLERSLEHAARLGLSLPALSRLQSID